MNIREHLSKREGVERAMLVLSLIGPDESSRQYYSNWIRSGRPLSGRHLERARNLALKYEAILRQLAEKKAALQGQGVSLVMNRQGTFKVATYGDSHCGTTNPLEVKYHAIIQCGTVTDKRGFLFDQLMVQGFFDSIKRTNLSCEKLAMRCTEGLVRRIRQENPGVQLNQVDMMLSPAPFMASMTYVWRGR